MAERLTRAVPEDLGGERVDRIVAVLGDMSRSAARELVEAGEVTVGGEAVTPRLRLAAGQTVTFATAPPAPELEPEPVDFGVVHEDHDLLVVDKPAGLVVHPGAGRREGTLAAGILHRHPEVEGVGDTGRWGLVHRLDRDTSGLMVVALTQTAYEGLRRQVEERTVEREYLALADGLFPVPTGTIDAPISRDPARPTRRRVDPEGRPARTHYQVEREFSEAGMTLLRVQLETGRTHQIRVHLAAIDHPLVGDVVYRPGPDRVPAPRVFLHACRLGFTHPISGEPLAFESPLPADLADVLTGLT
jgi:23S rRNA pseudouridine1911/1915/1917 synthase